MRSVRRDILPSFLDKLVSKYSIPSLMISGFWRSGTSVLLKALCSGSAKSVFEPFTWMLRGGNFSANPCAFPISSSTSSCSDKLLTSIFNSSIDGYWIRKERFSFLDSFYSRTVVKDVRIHFLLDELITSFNIPAIQLVRDPRAVYCSLLSWKFGSSYSNPDLAPLLDSLDLMHSPVHSLAAELARHVSSPIERFALLWCSLHSHINQCVGSNSMLTFVQYEDLILNPTLNIVRLSHCYPWIIPSRVIKVLAEDSSSVTMSSRKNLAPISRCFSWENSLSQQDQFTIVDMARKFNLTQFLRDPSDLSFASP